MLPKLRSERVPIFLSTMSKHWEKTDPRKRILIHSARAGGTSTLVPGLLKAHCSMDNSIRLGA